MTDIQVVDYLIEHLMGWTKQVDGDLTWYIDADGNHASNSNFFQPLTNISSTQRVIDALETRNIGIEHSHFPGDTHDVWALIETETMQYEHMWNMSDTSYGRAVCHTAHEALRALENTEASILEYLDREGDRPVEFIRVHCGGGYRHVVAVRDKWLKAHTLPTTITYSDDLGTTVAQLTTPRPVVWKTALSIAEVLQKDLGVQVAININRP